jgi:hypothetical protein
MRDCVLSAEKSMTLEQEVVKLKKQFEIALVIVHRINGRCKMVDWDACVAEPKTCIDKGAFPCIACKAALALKQIEELEK